MEPPYLVPELTVVLCTRLASSTFKKKILRGSSPSSSSSLSVTSSSPLADQYHPHVSGIAYHRALLHSGVQPPQLTSDFLREPPTSFNYTPPPTEYFEVTAPIELPKTKPCSQHILHHDFDFTYGHPPPNQRLELWHLGGSVPADLVLPISRNLPPNDGLWFKIENSTDEGVKEFKVPQNAYRAVLKVYVSFHERDEFWYTNPPDEYLVANNCSDVTLSCSFREVVVAIDGNVVGAVWPFTVIYTLS
ncbi:hypothetical protein Fmac_011090 [Flemingia macrophylla]|uniref:Peptide N-acetyl-beta-D-glucosaminyl asparaginase amidase A N-terminal domain-containing protein n=1 Tax=Flemingia macrophylla TaxID=520843 RepID=A0ABD1MLG1_9FABA